MGMAGSIFEKKKYTTPAWMISKIIAVVSEAVGKELKKDLESGKLKTDFFNFKAVSL